MKQLIFITIALLTFFSCNRHECECSSSYDCIDGQCVLKPNYMHLGGGIVAGHNLYYGVLPEGFCTDTIALDINLSDPTPIHRFLLYTKVQPWGLLDNSLAILEKYSDNEYLLTDFYTIFCKVPHNKEWYPTDMYCSITPDTVFLDFKLRERNDTVNRYVDSCKIAMPHI